MSDKNLKWISSDGGPLILMERNLVAHWRGNSDASSNERLSKDAYLTDYDRACSVGDYLGLIQVASGEALVLDDEPMQTAWLGLSKEKGLLVRWQWARDEASIMRTIGGIAEELWETTDLVFEMTNGELLLFDAACSGDEIDSGVRIALSPGEYLLDTACYRPNDETSLILHRLRRKS